MAERKAYSGLNLRGQPLRGLPEPTAEGDAATAGFVQTTVIETTVEVRDTLRTEIVQAVIDSREDGFVVVGELEPADAGPFLWVQTGLGPDGADMTFWVNA